MASLHQDERIMEDGQRRLKTPYWIAAFTDQFGRRRKRSTKKTSQKEARKVLDGWLKAIELKKEKRLTETRAREIIGEICGHRIYMPTVEQYFDDWLKGEKPTVSVNSYTKKEQAKRLFLHSLGDRKLLSLEAITKADIVKFRDDLMAEGRRAMTVNLLVRRIIAQPFRAAHKEGLIERDPVAGLKAVRGDHVEKHIFTAEQVQRLISTAKGDWKGLVIAGFYTGARLGDLANLTWDDVDLEAKHITFVQKKTGKKIQIPIADALQDYLLTLSMKDEPKSPVFPTLYGKTTGGKTGLSMAFAGLMAQAGIKQGTIRERGKGVSRKVSGLSFHSLRHSFNTILLKAGVPQELRMKLTGHSSKDMNAIYSHDDFLVIRQALEHLPRLAVSQS